MSTEQKTKVITAEQYLKGYLSFADLVRCGPYSAGETQRFPYVVVEQLPDGRYLVEDPYQ